MNTSDMVSLTLWTGRYIRVEVEHCDKFKIMTLELRNAAFGWENKK